MMLVVNKLAEVAQFVARILPEGGSIVQFLPPYMTCLTLIEKGQGF
jgi:hypothetical protein